PRHSQQRRQQPRPQRPRANKKLTSEFDKGSVLDAPLFVCIGPSKARRGRSANTAEPEPPGRVAGDMDVLFQEFSFRTTLPWQVISVRLVAAVILGGILGFERELTDRPA